MFDCDWSSDVCSSDLGERRNVLGPFAQRREADHCAGEAEVEVLPEETGRAARFEVAVRGRHHAGPEAPRSEEHTSELQSQSNLVCRLLLEKKKKNTQI